MCLYSQTWGPIVRGENLENLGRSVRPASQNPYLIWSKRVIFPTLFMTGPLIQNPIYDLTLEANPCFKPALQLVL